MYDQQVTVSAEDQSILHLLSLVAVGAAGCQMDEEMSRFPECPHAWHRFGEKMALVCGGIGGDCELWLLVFCSLGRAGVLCSE